MADKKTAKQAYNEELDKIRLRLSWLQDQYDATVGDGTLSDRINWMHVGDLEHVNYLLDQAVRFGGLKRVG